MPKPCRKPLAQNPYETYRDPVTGQWKVKYPVPAQVSIQLEGLAERPKEGAVSADNQPQRRTWRRQWKPSQTQVA